MNKFIRGMVVSFVAVICSATMMAIMVDFCVLYDATAFEIAASLLCGLLIGGEFNRLVLSIDD